MLYLKKDEMKDEIYTFFNLNNFRLLKLLIEI